MPTSKTKRKASTSWASYRLPGRDRFQGARWLQRWLRLKEELRLKIVR